MKVFLLYGRFLVIQHQYINITHPREPPSYSNQVFGSADVLLRYSFNDICSFFPNISARERCRSILEKLSPLPDASMNLKCSSLRFTQYIVCICVLWKKGKRTIDLLTKMKGECAIGLLSKIGKCEIICCFIRTFRVIFFLNCMLLLYFMRNCDVVYGNNKNNS